MVKVEFKHSPDMAYTPAVVPASRALPDWYKEMPAHTPDAQPWESSTLKACMPFFDAMTQGYIMPLWADLHVACINDESPTFTWAEGGKQQIESHGKNQVKGFPLVEKSYNENAYKFLSPWIIRTPKGYSSLFIAPVNQENNEFKIVSAVVATDEYFNPINFPFVWTAPKEWEGVLKQGMPLVQVIPFKRVDFEHDISPLTEGEINRVNSGSNALTSSFFGVYKGLWRKVSRSK
jgi:hypothetical protein